MGTVRVSDVTVGNGAMHGAHPGPEIRIRASDVKLDPRTVRVKFCPTKGGLGEVEIPDIEGTSSLTVRGRLFDCLLPLFEAETV